MKRIVIKKIYPLTLPFEKKYFYLFPLTSFYNITYIFKFNISKTMESTKHMHLEIMVFK